MPDSSAVGVSRTRLGRVTAAYDSYWPKAENHFTEPYGADPIAFRAGILSAFLNRTFEISRVLVFTAITVVVVGCVRSLHAPFCPAAKSGAYKERTHPTTVSKLRVPTRLQFEQESCQHF